MASHAVIKKSRKQYLLPGRCNKIAVPPELPKNGHSQAQIKPFAMITGQTGGSYCC